MRWRTREGNGIRFGGNTQAGHVVGRDYVSKSANWADSGRTWAAIDIAYQFF